MKNDLEYWKDGIITGVPICLGYMAVSFTFGIMAKNAGLTPWQAILMSATNLTSAGQFAALSLITASTSYFELAFVQLIINLRYSLMSCSLSQKIDSRTAYLHRFIIAFGISDEIFGVLICIDGKLNPFYSYGIMMISISGWVFGTFLGTISGNILPGRILNALGVALYGMFLAVIIPPSRGNKILSCLIMISMLMSLLFTKAPIISEVSPGFRIIILTIFIAGTTAILFPIKEEGK